MPPPPALCTYQSNNTPWPPRYGIPPSPLYATDWIRPGAGHRPGQDVGKSPCLWPQQTAEAADTMSLKFHWRAQFACAPRPRTQRTAAGHSRAPWRSHAESLVRTHFQSIFPKNIAGGDPRAILKIGPFPSRVQRSPISLERFVALAAAKHATHGPHTTPLATLNLSQGFAGP